MHFETSPGSSPSKSIPIPIRSMSSSTSSTSSLYSNSSSSSSSHGSTCAYPSWPTGKSLEYRNVPSSYVSDADLFGDDFDEEFGTPFLSEAPAPPRQYPMAQAFPQVLPPLYVQEKPKKQQQQPQQRRRSSGGRKQRRTSKPMSPIAESVESTE